MATPVELVGRLQVLFLRHFHVRIEQPDTDLLESGLLDSLQLIELLVRIEEEFGRRLTIDRINLDDVRSLSGLARLVAAANDFDPELRERSA